MCSLWRDDQAFINIIVKFSRDVVFTELPNQYSQVALDAAAKKQILRNGDDPHAHILAALSGFCVWQTQKEHFLFDVGFPNNRLFLARSNDLRHTLLHKDVYVITRLSIATH